ncbi:unnamed protein product [Diamesa hyperborea]
MASVLLEARPYRPFKSSEEYLYAMREDLAEWMNTLYPELMINTDNFMDRLDTGVALCKHANNVRNAAQDYVIRRQARQKSMTKSMTTGLAGPILSKGNVHYLPAAKCGTFFARDNVSNFISWCRKSLQIFECLLFETDDLIMRKNEKHVILCLLEVARRGAKFGMLAPMLVQMERQIDREIAADNKAAGVCCGIQTDTDNNGGQQMISTGTENEFVDSDSEDEDEDTGVTLMYGPQPQIVTNDLKSLDEMVRDLVEKCTCPSQFPMIRVSEGKYRIGDTKVLIFVRILRSHVMVRVGGGWDTLSHYLDKHDPCRCRAQHRSSTAAKLITRTNQQTNGIELHKAQVVYDRSPPAVRKFSTGTATPLTATTTTPPTVPTVPAGNVLANSNLSPPSRNRSRSRSPVPQRKPNVHHIVSESPSQTIADKSYLTASPHLSRRSMSPSPRRLVDMRKKQNSTEIPSTTNHISTVQIPLSTQELIEPTNNVVTEAKIELQMVNGGSNTVAGTDNGANKYENISDNGSEISDEGYRSLGLIQTNNKRISLHSQVSNEETETNGRLDRISPDVTTPTASDEPTISENIKGESSNNSDDIVDAIKEIETKFAKSGIYMSDDEITVDIAATTGLKKTGFSEVLYDDTVPIIGAKKSITKIPQSPLLQRRNSMEQLSSTITHRNDDNSSLRKIPAYRSIRKSQPIRDRSTSKENTWNGRSSASPTNNTKKRPSISTETFQQPGKTTSSPLARNTPTRTSQQMDARNRSRRATSSSVNTSPIKTVNNNHLQSPLAQQLLEAAGKAKNDAQILGKIKQILSSYASKNKVNGEFEDFTTTWVNNNGNLEAPVVEGNNNNGSPIKSLSKRSSTVSSSDSNPTTTSSRELPAVVSPRRNDKGLSRIPGPVRSNTGLY